MGKGGVFGKKGAMSKAQPPPPPQMQPLSLPPSVPIGGLKRTTFVGILSAAACGSAFSKAVSAHGVSLLALGGQVLASVSLGLWVHHQVTMHESCKGNEGEDKILVIDQGGKAIGVLDEEPFWQLVQSKSVTLYSFVNSARVQSKSERYCEEDRADVITHALFFQSGPCDLFDIEAHPFFYVAQRSTMVHGFVVPLRIFHRLSERLPPAEASAFLVIASIGRCGSTLLGQLINLHPHTKVIAELKDIPAFQILASQPHAAGCRYSTSGALLAAAAAGAALSLTSSLRILASASSSCRAAAAFAVAGSVYAAGLQLSAAARRRQVPGLLRACVRFWLKDCCADGNVPCVKLTASMSALFLADNARMARAAGLTNIRLIFLFRDLLPTLKSYLRTFGSPPTPAPAPHVARTARLYRGPATLSYTWLRVCLFVQTGMLWPLLRALRLKAAGAQPDLLGVGEGRDIGVSLGDLWSLRAFAFGVVPPCCKSLTLPPEAQAFASPSSGLDLLQQSFAWQQFVTLVSWLRMAQDLLAARRLDSIEMRSLSYDALVSEPSRVFAAAMRLVSLDESLVSEDAVSACMGRDSQQNSKVARNTQGQGAAFFSQEQVRRRAQDAEGTFSEVQISAFDTAIRRFGLHQTSVHHASVLGQPLI